MKTHRGWPVHDAQTGPGLRPLVRVAPLALALLLALSVPVPAQTASSDLRIVELLPDPDAAAGQREFVEILNAGNATVDLAGWKLRDAPTASGSSNTFTFPTWRLAPGERVVVWGGGAADAYGPAWSNSAVWNNAGDGATLLSPVGASVDWVGYGSTTPPADRAGAPVQAKPDKGRSLALDAGLWATGSPTPGLATGGVGAPLTLQVANAPPTVVFASVPVSARPGAAFEVALAAADPNGAADLASWSLQVDGVPTSSGNGAPPSSVSLLMPQNRTILRLTATVTDVGGLVATSQASVQSRWSDLELSFPPSGLGLADLMPGATITSQAPFRLHNAASAPRLALLDLGSLRGPAVVELAGRVEVGLVRGNATEWVPYRGPLTPLGILPAGSDLDLLLRIHAPDALPAGRYGASLAVVA